MSEPCAIIAGAGSFPVHVAREAARQGLDVVAIGLQGWADPGLAASVRSYEEVAVGELGRLIDRLKVHHTRQAIMAGKVSKALLFDPRVQFDAEALAILGQVRDFSVTGLLGAIAARLSKDGITLLDSSTFLKPLLCPVGPVTRQVPTGEQEEDIRIGIRAARQLAAMDIGQTVVVKRKVIVAVEALEGTDAAIQRAGGLAGPGCVVVKMASPDQDMRFDLPVLGLQTIATAAAAGVACLAVEAGKALLLDKDALIAKANEAGLCLIGVEPT